ncbi:unnamed protein product [Cyclocybe aegerita]|uniref:Alginate lyase domain-containing protein n=1 Tax=Cyclocybe aegerita TaxID=1973307 RepID=A0A8S0W1N9_CYCAE|nr:unnamed protein product [Cyclocybe aegerita]
MFRALSFVIFFAPYAIGDPTDWVNVDYVVARSKSTGRISSTADAEATIVRNAESTAKEGPWCEYASVPVLRTVLTVSAILNSPNILPPSKDPHDYLSWAPYHWPDCNWCTQAGRTHLVHTVNGSSSGTVGNSDNGTADLYCPNSLDYVGQQVQSILVIPARQIYEADAAPTSILMPESSLTSGLPNEPTVHPPEIPTTIHPTLPTAKPATSSTSDGRTHGPAQAAARTTQHSCTPSPTKSLAPTWTTCPYVTRDGQVNPDVRTLRGPGAINDAAQSILSNALAFALKRSSTYSQNVAKFIDTFFLSTATKMNPNVNFGQIVRGPGEAGHTGTFTGILDLRGMVKIANGITVLKALGSSDWTKTRDQAMESWISQYSDWLLNSSIGKMTASRPNNHATFYVAQVAAVKILAGDKNKATMLLQGFFKGQFLDQIAASGEQPFEAVRTRPWHYRCFNLEALITNAKLGDQLGIDLWSSKSKYGATIQKALDFLLTVDPKDEDVDEVFPHVAAIAAAYGDPKGTYAAYLKKKATSYQSKSYWFYDQANALPHSPASKNRARSVIWKREDTVTAVNASTPITPKVPWECPAVFQGVTRVEIDNGVYVTCDQLRPLYLPEDNETRGVVESLVELD